MHDALQQRSFIASQMVKTFLGGSSSSADYI